MTTRVKVTIGATTFAATLEHERAPHTVAAFLTRLPFESKLVQARWSGESGWVPLGDYDLGVDYENERGELAEVGRRLLYEGAQAIVFTAAD